MSIGLDDRPKGASSTAQSQRTSGRTLVLVGSLVAVAVMLALPVRSWLAQKAQLAELEGQIQAAQLRVADLDQQRERWQDPVYVAEQARLRLNLVQPGEMGLIVLDPHREPDVAQPDDGATETWYERLWESAQRPARQEAPGPGESTDVSGTPTDEP